MVLNNKKNQKAITLISLVITIVIMLILAGVAINLVIGNNGLFSKSKNSVDISKQKSADEKVQLLLSEYKMTNAESDKNLEEFLNEKVNSNEISELVNNGDHTFTFTIDGYEAIVNEETLEIISIEKIEGIRIKVTKPKVVYNADGTGDNITDKGLENDNLYISFEATLENGTINSVVCDKGTPAINNNTWVTPVQKNGTYLFIIKGNVEGESEEKEKKVSVVVNQFTLALKIGTYVKYPITYTDIYTGYTFTEDDGWRILWPGTVNDDGTYSNVKLISTGVPVNLNYDHPSMDTASYIGSADQISDYCSEFYGSTAENRNMRSASGLYYNFNKIKFSPNTNSGTNTGYYKMVNNKNNVNLTINDFLTNKASGVHNVTLFEMNTARNKKAGSDMFAVNQPDGSNFATQVLSTNDAAPGLFNLRGLAGKFQYTTGSVPYYWLSSPNSDNVYYIWFVRYDGVMEYNRLTEAGLRPVITLNPNVTLELGNN